MNPLLNRRTEPVSSLATLTSPTAKRNNGSQLYVQVANVKAHCCGCVLIDSFITIVYLQTQYLGPKEHEDLLRKAVTLHRIQLRLETYCIYMLTCCIRLQKTTAKKLEIENRQQSEVPHAAIDCICSFSIFYLTHTLRSWRT